MPVPSRMPLGRRGGRGQRHERVERALVLLGAARRRRSAGACGGSIGMWVCSGSVERVEAALLGLTRQLDGVIDSVGGEHGDAEAHAARRSLTPVRSDRQISGRRVDRHDGTVTGICEGRVVIVTGAGRGIGRGHALEFARQGAKVVVNDLGAELDGSGGSTGPAGEVVDEIRAAGRRGGRQRRRRRRLGRRRARWSRPRVDAFGGLDVVVNNAGFVRDRMFANAAEDEWDAVDPRAPQGPLRAGPPRRRLLARPGRRPATPVDARIINTTFGRRPPGQRRARAPTRRPRRGIAALTLVQAAELGRYGVTANAIAPAGPHPHDRGGVRRHDGRARRRRVRRHGPGERRRRSSCGWVSVESAGVTGRVFEVEGGKVSVADGWQHGPWSTRAPAGSRVDSAPAVRELLAEGARTRSGVRRRLTVRPAALTARRSYAPSAAAGVSSG